MPSFPDLVAAVIEKLDAEAELGIRTQEAEHALGIARDAWRAMDAAERTRMRSLADALGDAVRSRPQQMAPPPRPGDAWRYYDGPRDADALLGYVGLEGFRPGQREATQAALDGRDSLVVMPTGGGKSLCYQLPGLAGDQLTVVVTPLIALMADQLRRLTDDGHPAVMIASGMGEEDARAAYSALRSGTARIVFCSPERFSSENFVGVLQARGVDLFVIDEAHCLSEWGHDFRPDYMRLPDVIERLGRPTVMAATATATEAVADEIVQRLGLREPTLIRSGFDRPNLSFDVIAFEGRGTMDAKRGVLLGALAAGDLKPAIVYCGTRKDCESVAATLSAGGHRAGHYHAGMESHDRRLVQDAFMSGELDVIVATNAFGMGVDKADVRLVCHWAIPTSVEAYYQEAGRAGRDGAPGRALLLAARADLSRLIHFNEQRVAEQASAEARERGWRAYRAVEAYAFGEGCRRRTLLDHFGDHSPGAPEGRCCDHCDPDLQLGEPVRPPRAGGKARRRAAAAGAESSPYKPDLELYGALATWRTEAAAGKPAYTVANNRTLEAIADRLPRTPDQLSAIPGVGPAFLERHAVPVLALVAEHADAAGA